MALRFLPQNYTDPLFNAPGVGLQPTYYLPYWRGWFDTRPISWFQDGFGINFNVQPYQVTAVAQLLKASGITHARIEMDWGNYDYTTGLLTNTFFSLALPILQTNGIRPLILLNANSLVPCPAFNWNVTLQSNANIGDTSITIDTTSAGSSNLVLGKTGLASYLQNQSSAAWPLITAVNTSTGVCTLSRSLTVAITAGTIAFTTLKYHPFSGPFKTDGVTVNPWCNETFNAWAAYATQVCNDMHTILGNYNFDVEIWNETGFDSNFLNESNYYTTPPNQSPSLYSYTNWSQTTTNYNSILFLYILAPAADAIKAVSSSIRVINGFPNITNFGTAASTWKTIDAISHHFYSGQVGPIGPSNDPYPGKSPVNARGGNDGVLTTRGDFNTAQIGTYFIPSVPIISQPESKFWYDTTQPSVMTGVMGKPPPTLNPSPSGNFYINQDQFAAWTSPNYPHIWRGMTGFWGQTCNVWQTETAHSLSTWTTALHNAGKSYTDPNFIALANWMTAKCWLRLFIFQVHKGVQTVCQFSVNDGNDFDGFCLIPKNFFTVLGGSGNTQAPLTPAAIAAQGQGITALSNLATFVSQYIGTLTSVVPLTVTRVCEYTPTLIFSGDGTNLHPDRYQGDDFFIGAYQASDTVYIIPYYAATWNITQNYGVTGNVLDLVNYQMPDQYYGMSITGFAQPVISCSTYDPMTGKTLPAPDYVYVNGVLTVRVIATDYPRFLVVTII